MALPPDTIAQLNDLAADWYAARLTASPAAMAYLVERRGLTPDTIAAWRIGFAPAVDDAGRRDGSMLLRHLGAAGWGETAVIGAGLAGEGERGSYDVFRGGRIILPILDRDGHRVLAFGSRRLLDDDPRVPKYVNSPDTPLFHKSETLYGWPNADAIAAAGEAIVVEGNIDMLSLWQAGVRNVVAACGTAFTADQLFALGELAPRVTLVLDADAAGVRATRESLLMDAADRFDLGVVPLEGGKDPDEIIRSDPTAWARLVAGRVSRWEYLWRAVRAPYAVTLATDVEARVAWKDEWAELVRAHAAGEAQARRLLERAERELGLPDGLLIDEVIRAGLELPDEHDELLLAALAADWDTRRALAPLVALHGGAGSRQRDRWLSGGPGTLPPRLRWVLRERGADSERALSMEIARQRGAIGDRLRELQLASMAPGVGDARASELRAEMASLRALSPWLGGGR